jgi:hypothetical protein
MSVPRPLVARLETPSAALTALQALGGGVQGRLRLLQAQAGQLLRQLEEGLRAALPPPPPPPFALFQADMLRVFQDEGFQLNPEVCQLALLEVFRSCPGHALSLAPSVPSIELEAIARNQGAPSVRPIAYCAAQELRPIIANAWAQLSGGERAAYEARAGQEAQACQLGLRLYAGLLAEAELLAAGLGDCLELGPLPPVLEVLEGWGWERRAGELGRQLCGLR